VEGEPNNSDYYSIFFPEGGATIPVQWKSTYDGRQMEDTFEITVTGSGGTTVDDDGFSGGGGTF
jgi:hypothetical protein